MPLSIDQYFASRGTSLTALGTFDKCPLQFALKYLRYPMGGGPEAPVASIFRDGIALHHAIEVAYEALINTGIQLSFAEIDSAALEKSSDVARRGGTSSPQSKKLTFALQQFYDLYYVAERYIPIAAEFECSVGLAPGVKFRFRTDLLARDAESGEICVVDFKIGRRRVFGMRVAEGIQTGSYAWGLDEALQIGITSAHTVYLSSGGREKVPITPEGKESFRVTILEMVKVVRDARDFNAKPSKRTCAVCDYRLACPYSRSK